MRDRIERIKGRRRFLERRGEFTAINLTLRDVAGGIFSQTRKWSSQTTLTEAINALTRSLQGIGAGIWLAVWLPV